MSSEDLTPRQAAAIVDLAVGTLANLRAKRNRGPAYYKVGHYVRYREQDLRAWLQGRRRRVPERRQ